MRPAAGKGERWPRVLGMALAVLAAGCGDSDRDTSSSGRAPSARELTGIFVSAAAKDVGDGTRARPFRTLQAAEAASGPGDTIVVLPAPLTVPPLDGGIALKPGQRLIGAGPDVVLRRPAAAVAGAAALEAVPRIRNSNPLRLDGDAVRLADRNEVRNLVITDSVRGAIYGLNAPDSVIQGNDISGYNTSCAIGFVVEPFSAPTTGPYIGVPALLPAGWAGIMLDADRGSGRATVNDNYLHDSACGNGIDLRINGTADYRAEISGNFITELKHGPLHQAEELHLVHAITLQITDAGALDAVSAHNTQTFIGAPGADCEGLFLNLSGTASAVWRIDHNYFAHGIGGFSCNGMEFIISNGRAHGEMYLSNSRFEDNPGDMFEQANLGSGSTAILELDHVVVKDTHERGGAPDAGFLPFNLGECLLTGSTGTGNITILKIRDSEFSGCNNGLSLLSGMNLTSNLLGGLTTGQLPDELLGPDGLMSVEIVNSAFRDNAASNIVVGVIAGLRELELKVQGSDFSGGGDNGVALRKVYLGDVERATIDFGGGALGSTGGNCIFGAGAHDVLSEGFAASMQRNWWGQPQGPDPAKIAAGSAALDTQFALTTPPRICSE